MNFGALPPEINSASMYSGPGAAALLTAAAAWDQLSSELSFSAGAYSSVIANLAGAGWQGPASTTMAAAVAPYVAWLHATAGQAAQTATAVRAAVGAYEAAFAATVPPPLIAANRTKLTALIATNFFGQNSPAIAATEAAYDAMWAQDTTAMVGYAHASAAATQLTPFSKPPQTTNPAGQAAQTAAVAQAAAASTGHAQDVTALSGLTTASQGLAASASTSSASAPSATIPVIAGEPITAYAFQAGNYGGMALSTNNEVWRLINLGARITGWYASAQRDFAQGIGPFSPIFGIPLPPVAPAAAASAVSAVTGHASVVNALSVPPSWAVSTAAEIAPAAAALPTAGAASEVFVGPPGSALFAETLLGTLAGRAVSSAAATVKTGTDKVNRVIPRSPAAG